MGISGTDAFFLLTALGISLKMSHFNTNFGKSVSMHTSQDLLQGIRTSYAPDRICYLCKSSFQVNGWPHY